MSERDVIEAAKAWREARRRVDGWVTSEAWETLNRATAALEAAVDDCAAARRLPAEAYECGTACCCSTCSAMAAETL